MLKSTPATAIGSIVFQSKTGSIAVRSQPKSEWYTIGGIESFAEATRRNQKKVETRINTFQIIKADRKLSMKTGFDIGDELYYIERVRLFDSKALIFDTNYFLKSETEGLSPDIASKSIYHYLEDELHMTITTSRRRITAQQATERDRELLDLNHFDFILSVAGQVFNSRGVMFEYTESRHVPDQVCFVESAVRQKV